MNTWPNTKLFGPTQNSLAEENLLESKQNITLSVVLGFFCKTKKDPSIMILVWLCPWKQYFVEGRWNCENFKYFIMLFESHPQNLSPNVMRQHSQTTLTCAIIIYNTSIMVTQNLKRIESISLYEHIITFSSVKSQIHQPATRSFYTSISWKKGILLGMYLWDRHFSQFHQLNHYSSDFI